MAISSKSANPYDRREDCPKQIGGRGSGAHEKWELEIGSGERASFDGSRLFIGLEMQGSGLLPWPSVARTYAATSVHVSEIVLIDC